MQQDVTKFVKACHSCQIMKASRQLPQGLLQPLPVPKERWKSISMDFITTLPRTTIGNAQILVIVDQFSKMAHFIPCKKAASTPDIASLFDATYLQNSWVAKLNYFCQRSEIYWTFWDVSVQVTWHEFSAYHFQTDGQTERVN
ncbi:hypothetical protein L7F22_001616 [Adiantum nelumboides]|nr:hypothetical protein [Adiantum nelumboides]